jgi:hypothetical protein
MFISLPFVPPANTEHELARSCHSISYNSNSRMFRTITAFSTIPRQSPSETEGESSTKVVFLITVVLVTLSHLFQQIPESNSSRLHCLYSCNSRRFILRASTIRQSPSETEGESLINCVTANPIVMAFRQREVAELWGCRL